MGSPWLALLISAIFGIKSPLYYEFRAQFLLLVSAILGVGICISFATRIYWRWRKLEEGQRNRVVIITIASRGFYLTILLMLFLRMVTRKSKDADELFKGSPRKHSTPPFWIRGIFGATCTLVSYFHGNNDGQKGVGLIMLILIGIVPALF